MEGVFLEKKEPVKRTLCHLKEKCMFTTNMKYLLFDTTFREFRETVTSVKLGVTDLTVQKPFQVE